MTIAVDKQVKLPNFLIVGAARSGTSSLHSYLRQHPEIYMPTLKEPKFMTAQFLKFPFSGPGDNRVERDIIKDFNGYKKLFEDLGDKKAIGEASADNLYFYEGAIRCIKKYLGDVKIIIILRNPIERAFSSYLRLSQASREKLPFEDALEEENKRREINWEFIWHYTAVGLYYKQVNAYMENFEQVKIYLCEDLEKNPIGLAKDMFGYLEVNPSFLPDVRIRYGFSDISRNKYFKFLTEKNALKSVVEQSINKLPPWGKEKLYQMHYRLKAKYIRPQLKRRTKEKLKNFYREDMLKLQELIKRDLSGWL